ncbi:putative serine/threonine protein kinase [Blattamonas nauphoetae]|uniref:non-specific serine/threonine protein kinase n=1 Tax=Blattamonas nauphoetae TaxID=2049346 RepID=A0ABQ9XEG7_9EUKA|nr:putative serine/threonine protein kinase [Blattamonas nauphoetae]
MIVNSTPSLLERVKNYFANSPSGGRGDGSSKSPSSPLVRSETTLLPSSPPVIYIHCRLCEEYLPSDQLEEHHRHCLPMHKGVNTVIQEREKLLKLLLSIKNAIHSALDDVNKQFDQYHSDQRDLMEKLQQAVQEAEAAEMEKENNDRDREIEHMTEEDRLSSLDRGELNHDDLDKKDEETDEEKESEDTKNPDTRKDSMNTLDERPEDDTIDDPKKEEDQIEGSPTIDDVKQEEHQKDNELNQSAIQETDNVDETPLDDVQIVADEETRKEEEKRKEIEMKKQKEKDKKERERKEKEEKEKKRKEEKEKKERERKEKREREKREKEEKEKKEKEEKERKKREEEERKRKEEEEKKKKEEERKRKDEEEKRKREEEERKKKEEKRKRERKDSLDSPLSIPPVILTPAEQLRLDLETMPIPHSFTSAQFSLDDIIVLRHFYDYGRNAYLALQRDSPNASMIGALNFELESSLRLWDNYTTNGGEAIGAQTSVEQLMRDGLAVQLYTPQNDPPSAQSRSERTPLSQSSRPLAPPTKPFHTTPSPLTPMPSLLRPFNHPTPTAPRLSQSSEAKPAPVVRPPNIVVIQFGQHLQAHIDHLKRQILMAQAEYKNVHRSLRKTASIANMSQNRSYANTPSISQTTSPRLEDSDVPQPPSSHLAPYTTPQSYTSSPGQTISDESFDPRFVELQSGSPQPTEDDESSSDDGDVNEHLIFRRRTVSIEDFDVKKKISRGAFGRVYLVKKKTTGDLYAMKEMDKNEMQRKNLAMRVRDEERILQNLHNPFIVDMIYSFQNETKLFLVMEYCPGGDLYSLLKNLNSLSEPVAKQYTAELVIALEYLHAHNIIHRDLKPDNVLVAKDGHLKLIDFGLSHYKYETDDEVVQPETLPSAADKLEKTEPKLVMFEGFGTMDITQMEKADLRMVVNIVSGLFALRKEIEEEKQQQKEEDKTSLVDSPFANVHATAAGVINIAKDSTQFKTTDSFFELAQFLEGEDSDGEDNKGTGIPPLEWAKLTLEEKRKQRQRSRTLAFSCVGTPDYLSPEIVQKKGHTAAVDWWALGCMLYEFLVGVPPFYGSSPDEIFENILQRRIEWPMTEGEDGEPVPLVSPLAQSLIEQLLTLDPNERLGSKRDALEIREHPFFQGTDWEGVRSAPPAFVPVLQDPEGIEYFEVKEVFQESDEKRRKYSIFREQAIVNPLPDGELPMLERELNAQPGNVKKKRARRHRRNKKRKREQQKSLTDVHMSKKPEEVATSPKARSIPSSLSIPPFRYSPEKAKDPKASEPIVESAVTYSERVYSMSSFTQKHTTFESAKEEESDTTIPTLSRRFSSSQDRQKMSANRQTSDSQQIEQNTNKPSITTLRNSSISRSLSFGSKEDACGTPGFSPTRPRSHTLSGSFTDLREESSKEKEEAAEESQEDSDESVLKLTILARKRKVADLVEQALAEVTPDSHTSNKKEAEESDEESSDSAPPLLRKRINTQQKVEEALGLLNITPSADAPLNTPPQQAPFMRPIARGRQVYQNTQTALEMVIPAAPSSPASPHTNAETKSIDSSELPNSQSTATGVLRIEQPFLHIQPHITHSLNLTPRLEPNPRYEAHSVGLNSLLRPLLTPLLPPDQPETPLQGKKQAARKDLFGSWNYINVDRLEAENMQIINNLKTPTLTAISPSVSTESNPVTIANSKTPQLDFAPLLSEEPEHT